MEIRRATGIEGAKTAQGPTVVIDVFRAYSAAAYAFAAGATKILLASEVDEALRIAAGVSNAVLMGEVAGVRPVEFDFGNSPGEIVARVGDLEGTTVVHRSSAGTRAAKAALGAGAEPLYVSSLVVASATAAALMDQTVVTLIASGESGISPAIEDEICADVLSQLILGDRSDLGSVGRKVAATERARYLDESSFAHADDVRLCCDTDRFDFAMKVTEVDGLVLVHPVL